MGMDDRVSAYIARSAAFARPILEHIRGLVHRAVPDVSETIKWGMPFFELEGRPLAMMAAFKAHAGLGIFDGTPMASGAGMGQFGKLASVADLPGEAVLQERLALAARIIAEGKPTMRPAPATKSLPKPPVSVPDDLATALAAAPVAQRLFAGFPPGARREYVDWVESAKRPATRAQRIATTVEWVSGGKRRNWKYEDC